MEHTEEQTKEIEFYNSASSRAMTLEVTDDATYTEMANLVLLCNKAIKFFNALYDPRIKQSNEVTKALRADKARLQTPAETAQERGDKQLADYRERKQRAAIEAQKKLDQEQKDQEEKERSELAELYAQLGQPTQAQQVLEAPSTKAPVLAPPVAPEVDGLSFREDWDFEIVDEKLIPPEYLMADEVKIRKVVKAMKEACRIPGIRAFKKPPTPVHRS